jgi:hypothetical protein
MFQTQYSTVNHHLLLILANHSDFGTVHFAKVQFETHYPHKIMRHKDFLKKDAGREEFIARVEVVVGAGPGTGEDAAILHERNFLSRPQSHSVGLCAPKGIGVEPAILAGTVDSRAVPSFPLRLHVATDLKPGVYTLAFDTTLDGKRYGQRFDMILSVDP